MADAIVGATIKVLLEKALSLSTDRMGLMFSLKGELEDLRESMVTIQAVLADADDKQSHSKAMQLWLKRLEGVAFDADHMFDELHYETLRRKVVKYRNQQLKGSKVCFFFSSHARIDFRWKMASKIRDINTKLKKINQEAHDFGLNNRHQIEARLSPTAGVRVSRQTDSIVPPYVVRRTNDESRIVEMLLSSSEEVVRVTPIVGMGGMGKTTLVKLIYNNPQVDKHFGKKCWVCVSEKFEEVEILKHILESLTERKVELSNKDAIVQQIRNEIEGERCLLVLDDVWNKNKKIWDDFFDSLMGIIPMNGSRCVVTTRLVQVASIVSRHSPYLLEKLSDDDCWSIIIEKAINSREVPPKLIAMKQQILKRCGGVPLAARVLGGLLQISREEEWLSVLEKKLLNLREDENNVEQILKLSFDNLPSSAIKKCFAYCSIFPKDREMERHQLIELWMAEGFLQPNPYNQSTMEDLGDQYITTLLQSSLLEQAYYSPETYCQMHDLVHDLAEAISIPKLVNDEIDNHSKVRYLALTSSDEMIEKNVEDLSTSVRTLFVEGISCDTLPMFKNLYVLNLARAHLKKLPTSIGELTHLRFLATSFAIKTLPESVCKLYCLQTLRVKSLDKLPNGMSSLISLRHLYYNGWNIPMPLEMGRLTCLQTLRFFNVGEKKGRQIEELRCLKYLKGKLEIRNLDLVNGKQGAEGANLSGKPNLLKLIFDWNSKNREGANCDKDVLEGLHPHANLQELKISNFLGDKFPQWLMNLSTTLHKLVDLRLINCKRCIEVPGALGQLPFLRYLHFKALPNVKTIGHSFYDITTSGGSQQPIVMSLFPALKTFILEDMENLEEWMEPKAGVVNVFPMLEELFISGCAQLVNAPSHFPSLRYLTIVGNDHVSVVKKILTNVMNLSGLGIVGLIGMAGLTCLSDVTHNHHQFDNLRCIALHKCGDFSSAMSYYTSLESLQIADCDSWREIPEALSTIRSLRKLEIRRCPIIYLRQQSLPTITHLIIDYCEGLTSIVLEACPSLVLLDVRDCPNLVSFPMLEHLHESPNVSELCLVGCPKLMTMPRGFALLTRLSWLEFGPFSDDSLINNKFDWSGLISSSKLRSLTLYGMPHTGYLPNQLQYLTSLQTLQLQGFGGMKVLPNWIENLASLRQLCLLDCEKLSYLPSEAAMRRFKVVQGTRYGYGMMQFLEQSKLRLLRGRLMIVD